MNDVNQASRSLLDTVKTSLYVRSDSDFTSTMTIGQVIKGKVLRHYEGGGYLVSFNGQEKVVDSAIPLTSGEIIRGRIVGLGEQVQLHRLRDDADMSRKSEHSNSASISSANVTPREKVILELFNRYNMPLSTIDIAIMTKVIRTRSEIEIIAMSGLILRKVGLSLTPELLRAVTRVLHGDKGPTVSTETEVPQLSYNVNPDVSDSRVSIEALAAFLIRYVQADRKEYDLRKSEQQCEDNASEISIPGISIDEEEIDWTEWLLGRWILNVQSEGAVAHRVIDFPLWFDNKLLEVRMALFSQQKNTGHSNGLRFQRIAFALDTESLGHVEIILTASNRNLRLAIAAKKESAVNIMAAYMQDLQLMLIQYGWTTDEISYLLKDEDDLDAPMRTVAEHHITQDSLNRLI